MRPVKPTLPSPAEDPVIIDDLDLDQVTGGVAKKKPVFFGHDTFTGIMPVDIVLTGGAKP